MVQEKRTSQMSKFKRKRHARLISLLQERDGDNCHWCGLVMRFRPREERRQKSSIEATIEHLQKRVDGGSWDLGNLVLAHGECNWGRERKDTEHHLSRVAKAVAFWLWMETKRPGKRPLAPIEHVFIVDMHG